jgi:hypothetical protein
MNNGELEGLLFRRENSDAEDIKEGRCIISH